MSEQRKALKESEQASDESAPPQGGSAPEMTFKEALTRASAAHVPLRTVYQPGNGYRREHVCKCGAYVFAVNWKAHVLKYADALRAEGEAESR